MALARRSIVTSVLAAVAFVALGSQSNAAVVEYFGQSPSKANLTVANAARGAFLSTLSTYGVDDLEDTTLGAPAPSLSFVGSFPLTATTNYAFAQSFGGAYSVSGTVFLYDGGPMSEGGPGASDDFIQLASPVTAFGSYFTNGGSESTSNTVTLRLSNGTDPGTYRTVTRVLGPSAGDNNVFFWGVTDTNPFDRITLIESLDFDGILLDDLTVGNLAPVPEPSSIALMVFGSAGLLWAARRRQQRAAA